MKDRDFLRKAVKAEQLDIVEPSDNIFQSYLGKSENCIKAAELLIDNNLYEKFNIRLLLCYLQLH